MGEINDGIKIRLLTIFAWLLIVMCQKTLQI